MNISALNYELTQLLGRTNSKLVSSWMAKQFKRTASAGNATISLEDARGAQIYSLIEVTINESKAQKKLFINNTLVLPVLDPETEKVEPIIEFTSTYFEEHLKELGFNAHSISIVHEYDQFVFNGQDAHADSKAVKSDRGEVIGAYINFDLPSGEPACLRMSAKELQKAMADQVAFKYGGVNPFSDEEWNDFYRSCILRRFIESMLFERLVNVDAQQREPLMYAIDHHIKLFLRGQTLINRNKQTYQDGWVKYELVNMFSTSERIQASQPELVVDNSNLDVKTKSKQAAEKTQKPKPTLKVIKGGAYDEPCHAQDIPMYAESELYEDHWYVEDNELEFADASMRSESDDVYIDIDTNGDLVNPSSIF